MSTLCTDARQAYRFLCAISAKEAIASTVQTAPIRELRILQKASKSVIAGRFDNRKILARVIREIDDPQISGMYYTLNSVGPTSNVKKLNTLDVPAWRTVNDGEIPFRDLILIDCDPIRPSGVCSTEPEKRFAFHVADQAQTFLTSHGWPEPIRVDSGNGVHLLYRLKDGFAINGRQDDRRLRTVLGVLDAACSTAECKIDQSVFNASRIARLPGSINRKGSDSPDRPWRRCELLSIPDPLIRVTSQNFLTVERLAAPQVTRTKNTVRPRDEQLVWQFMEEYPDHFSCSATRKRDGVIFFDLDECPFEAGPHSNHGPGKTCLIFGESIGFHCFADQCADYKFKDLVELLYEDTGEYPETKFPRHRNQEFDKLAIPTDEAA